MRLLAWLDNKNCGQNQCLSDFTDRK